MRYNKIEEMAHQCRSIPVKAGEENEVPWHRQQISEGRPV
jgi:hypothetical protein